MTERPHSRYTREKTWQALYSQAINACYALVPGSATNNSIWLKRCETPEETQSCMTSLLSRLSEIESFFNGKPVKREERREDNYWQLYHQWLTQKPACLRNAGEAVVLARSSDYWRYHLEDQPGLALVVAGQHDSYLHLPCLETSSNRRYAARETAIKIGSPEFEKARRTQQAHNCLVAALATGDQAALAHLKSLPERTRRRLRQEAEVLQAERYRGRPLAFHTEIERQAIGQKISNGLLLYHAKKRAG